MRELVPISPNSPADYPPTHWSRRHSVGKLLGLLPDPETAVVNVSGHMIRITADGNVLSATYNSGVLCLQLQLPSQDNFNVAVAGVDKPQKIEMVEPKEQLLPLTITINTLCSYCV